MKRIDVTDADEPPNSDSDQVIERGQTYTHSEYDRVEVTGIWRGVHRVDTAHNADESDVIIVRYTTEQGETPVEELTDTLDEFLEAVE